MQLGHRALIFLGVGLCGCQPRTAAPASLVPVASALHQPGASAPPGATPAAETPASTGDADQSVAWARSKRPLELEVSYRLTDDGEVGNASSFQLQPMLFWNRRILFGTRFGIDPIIGENAFDAFELDLYLGYQHFLSNTTVPYLRAIVGAASVPDDEVDEEKTDVVNFGAEVGVKLYASRSFYAVLAAGSTRTAPIYGSLGFGLGVRKLSGGGDIRAVIVIPIFVAVAAALVPWGIDRAAR